MEVQLGRIEDGNGIDSRSEGKGQGVRVCPKVVQVVERACCGVTVRQPGPRDLVCLGALGEEH